MDRATHQRQHYDELIRTERPTQYLLSCGFRDRHDPTLLERRPALRRALGRLFDRALPHRDEGPVGTLLDLGCGTGYYWPLLRPRCERLLGVDLAGHGGLRHVAPRRAACGHGGQRVIRLPLASASIDVALAVDALHHLDDLSATLAELRRVIRPGGSLVAVEPNVFNPVVLMAHLVPPEERGALFPHHPLAVLAALKTHFDEVEVTPVTYVSGIEDPRVLGLVERVEPLFERPPLAQLALRRLYRARRPPR